MIGAPAGSRGLLPRIAACALLAVGSCAYGATINVNNLDAGTGLGFDDPTAVAPVTGNPGVTLGQQRLNAFVAAADQWAAILVSPVTIVVDATMTQLSCGPTGGVLGSAGTNTVHRDFTNAPLPNTWYPQALANSVAGFDLSASADIGANFNRSVDDDPNCLTGVTWSYVVGAPAPPGTIAFTDTVLHEIAHGLGVAGFTSLSSGAFFAGFPDHYGTFLYSETLDQSWIDLTDAERAATATDTGNLTWAGPEVENVDDFLSAGVQASGRTQMYAPASLATGSSVNHFDTALTPNELMEPFATASNEQLLTNHLLLDVGWKQQLAAAVSLSDGLTEIPTGDPTTYAITVQNNGPGDIRLVDATVSSDIPNLLNVTWSCSGSGGGSCASASGVGAITDESITVPRGGSVTFDLSATVDPAFSGPLNGSATLTMPDNILNTLSNTDGDSTTVLPQRIQVTPTSGLVTDEGGGTDSFSVVLGLAPSDDVVIGISSSDETEGTVSTSSLTFTTGNWNTPQDVTVTGVDDADLDGDVAYSIVTAPAVSTDGDFNGLDPSDVDVTNLNDDVGIIVSAISGNTTEPGGTATFTVAAATSPSGSVTIGLTSSDTGEGTVPASVVLPSGSTAAQMVTVTGVDDALDDGDVAYNIVTAAASSADPGYNGLDPADIPVVNEDDDFLVGGTVTGTIGSGLVLQNNAGDNLTISATGPFDFPTPLADGSNYLVTIFDPPDDPSILCELQNASGVIDGADVTSVSVDCVDTCNFEMVSNVTVNSTVDHEACEALAIGPDYVAENPADVFLSSGEVIILLPGFRLEQGATLDAAVCGQSLCAPSQDPMPDGCHSCVVDICTVDPTCCTDAFNQTCVNQVFSVCGLVCE